jgi:hypothetical protein
MCDDEDQDEDAIRADSVLDGAVRLLSETAAELASLSDQIRARLSLLIGDGPFGEPEAPKRLVRGELGDILQSLERTCETLQAIAKVVGGTVPLRKADGERLLRWVPLKG